MATKKTASKKASSRKSASAKSTSHAKSHTLDTNQRKHIAEDHFAFPEQRKEPLNDASHVRNAIARFDQVKDVSDAERTAAFKRIKAAARKYGVELKETSWKQLGGKPHTRNAAG